MQQKDQEEVLTLRVQQFSEAQVLLGQVEGVLQVVVNVGLLQLVKINEIRPVSKGRPGFHGASRMTGPNRGRAKSRNIFFYLCL